MKLIFKALYNKKLFQYGILILVLVLTVCSIQMSATVTLKNKTMIQKVNAINAAHTNIYVADTRNLDNQESDDDIPDYLSRVNEENDIDLVDSVENTYFNILLAQNLHEIDVNQMSDKQLASLQNVYLEGYVSHKGTNNYKMLKGKSYRKLKGNEIVINEQCARDLERKHMKVIGGTFYNNDTNYRYKIVGVYEDPAYTEDATSNLKDTTILKTDLQTTKFHALGNFDTVKKNAIRIEKQFNTVELEEEPYMLYQVVHKIHLTDYSVENESKLLTLIQINSVGANYAQIYPLYYQLQDDNMTQNIFKYLSYTLLAALIVSDFFVFYAFFKRKLDEDKNKLAMMVLCGIKQKNIIKAYLSELGVLSGATLLICAALNFIGCFILQLHKQPYLSMFFDAAPQLLKITLLLALVMFILLGIMIILQIKHFFTNNLTRVMKEKDLTIKKPPRITIDYKRQLIQMSLRDLLANKFKFIRVVFATSFLILCMLLTFCSYETLDHLYNRETIGLTFDYTISHLNKKQYQKLKQDYLKDVSILNTSTRYFMEKTGEIDGIDVYQYYDAALITLYDDVKPDNPQTAVNDRVKQFMNKQSGVYPKPGVDVDALGNLYYYQREALLPRKLMELKGAITDENANAGIHKKGLAFSYMPYLHSMYQQDNYMYIKGGINSLINNGYVTFTAMTAGKQLPIDKLVLNTEGNDIGNGIVINLKKGVSKKVFESYLKKEGISFTSYDEILKQMAVSNHQINRNTFAVMTVVMGIMILMFIILTIANITEEEMHKQTERSFMIRTGWSHSFVKRLSLTKSILMLMTSCVIALLVFFPIKWFYFHYLFQILGIYAISTAGNMILLLPFLTILVFLIWMLILNHKKHLS